MPHILLACLLHQRPMLQWHESESTSSVRRMNCETREDVAGAS